MPHRSGSILPPHPPKHKNECSGGILPPHPPLHRKSNRIPDYYYGSTGAYFITICSKNMEQIFNIISRSGILPPQTTLTDIGFVIEQEILRIPEIYGNVIISKFVIMPNHVHMIIEILDNGGKMPPLRDDGGKMPPLRNAGSVGQIVNQWKRAISIKLGFSPWQKSFHDHVIRNQEDYNRIAEYVDNNPEKWSEDRYYTLP